MIKKVSSKIADLDNFGPTVALNFRGKDRFKTTRGGLITIVSYLVVLLLAMELIERWFTRKDPVIASYEVFGHPEGKQVFD